MKRKRERAPISLYRRDNGIYYARKWNAEEGKYTDARSTGERRKGPAFAAGLRMLEAGELRTQAKDPLLLAFLADYWKRTPRVRSVHYRAESVRIVETHVASFAQLGKLRLSRVRGFHLNRLRDFLETEAACKAPDGTINKGLSARMVNRSLQAVLVPLRWAFRRGHIGTDVSRGAEKVRERFRKRGILSLVEVQKIIGMDCRPAAKRGKAKTPVPDQRQKAAVLLGALAGLRRGELRALTWSDVDFEGTAGAGPTVHVRRSFIDGDGFKEPKADSSREVPLCAPLAAALSELRAASP